MHQEQLTMGGDFNGLACRKIVGNANKIFKKVVRYQAEHKPSSACNGNPRLQFS
jgi:hypothetical protein